MKRLHERPAKIRLIAGHYLSIFFLFVVVSFCTGNVSLTMNYPMKIIEAIDNQILFCTL